MRFEPAGAGAFRLGSSFEPPDGGPGGTAQESRPTNAVRQSLAVGRHAGGGGLPSPPWVGPVSTRGGAGATGGGAGGATVAADVFKVGGSTIVKLVPAEAAGAAGG